MTSLLDTTAIPDPESCLGDHEDYSDCDGLPPGMWFTSTEMRLDPQLMFFDDEDLEHHGAYSRPKIWSTERCSYKADYGPQAPWPVPGPDDEYDDMSIWSAPARD